LRRIGNATPCHHDETNAKALTGSWITSEFYTAVLAGYKIIEIHDVWHYRETVQYDSVNELSGLFDGYIDTFIKAKQTYSGFPPHVTTEEQKKAFCDEFFRAENIQLDYREVEKNETLRYVAKLCCNSLWGKLCQRTQLTRTTIVDTTEEFQMLLTDPSKEVNDLWPINEEQMLISYTPVETAVFPNERGNVVVAATVTAEARLRLYAELKNINTRSIYCDTDSIIYESVDGEPEPDVGNFLGSWTDEVPPNLYITDFVSTGPKTYAIRYSNGTHTFRCKGITLNKNNQKKFTFE
jgi:hypothetical protein